jgi:hypothetical protein
MQPDTTPSPIVTAGVYGRSWQWVLEKSATLDVKWPGGTRKTSQVES